MPIKRILVMLYFALWAQAHTIGPAKDMGQGHNMAPGPATQFERIGELLDRAQEAKPMLWACAQVMCEAHNMRLGPSGKGHKRLPRIKWRIA